MYIHVDHALLSGRPFVFEIDFNPVLPSIRRKLDSIWVFIAREDANLIGNSCFKLHLIGVRGFLTNCNDKRGIREGTLNSEVCCVRCFPHCAPDIISGNIIRRLKSSLKCKHKLPVVLILINWLVHKIRSNGCQSHCKWSILPSKSYPASELILNLKP